MCTKIIPNWTDTKRTTTAHHTGNNEAVKWVRIALMELWSLSSDRRLLSNCSQTCTHNPTTHTYTHTFTHLLTLKILIWHSNAGDWQLRHASLTDQTWFTMHVWSVCVYVCVILWGKDEQRELGVRIVNLKVSHIMSFIYPAPPPPANPHPTPHTQSRVSITFVDIT